MYSLFFPPSPPPQPPALFTSQIPVLIESGYCGSSGHVHKAIYWRLGKLPGATLQKKTNVSSLAVSHQHQQLLNYTWDSLSLLPIHNRILAAEFYTGFVLSLLLLLFFEAEFFYVGQIVLELFL